MKFPAGAQSRTVSASSAAAILGWRFEPALLRGVPAAQLVERGFRFVP